MLYLVKTEMPTSRGLIRRYHLFEWVTGKEPQSLCTEETIPGITKFSKENDYDVATIKVALPKDWPLPIFIPLNTEQIIRFEVGSGRRIQIPKIKKQKTKNETNKKTKQKLVA
ncbi:MAG: hypothetical protein WCN88_01580 [Candidatus Falkowbacteria bacterium]